MGTRLGIELSPVACRIVELEGVALVPGQPPATRVRSYAVLPPSGPETDQRFASLGRRPVAVVVWGVRRDHRQVVVSNGSYETMRAEALASARAAGVDTRNTIADIAPASTAIKGANRQPVVLVLAGADEVSTAIRPLINARLRIRSVVTPADALLGLARSRQAFAVPGGIEAYVALDATMTCLALVRDGSLLSAREVGWGYEAASGAAAASQAPEEMSRRDDLAARLLDELSALLTTVGADRTAVTQVSICGGLPDLRTMTVPLMERLDVEVETLDSLFGIDAEHLPEPAEEFRERAAELRLAWGAAADWRGPINLMRYRRRRNRRVVLARAAVVAGVAVGLGAGLAIQRSQWWASTAPQRVARRTAPAVPPPQSPAAARGNVAPRPQTPVTPITGASVPPARPPAAPTVAPAAIPTPSTAPSSPVIAASKTPAAIPSTPAPAVAAPPAAARAPVAVPPVARVAPPVTPPARTTPPPVMTPPPPAVTAARPALASPPPVTPTRPPALTAAPAASRPPPPVTPARPPAVTTARPAMTTPPPVTPAGPSALTAAPPTSTPPPLVTPARPSAVTATPPASTMTSPPATAARPPREEAASAPAAVAAPRPVGRRVEPPPIPFDAQLGTILYAPDRKFAIVNGRIVGPGDEVNGARIVDITPTTVLLRDAQGRLRSLTLIVERTP